MKLAIINDGAGTTRVHAATCADVKREVTKFRTGDAYVAEFVSRKDCNEDWWGDVATDRFEYDTPEWAQECRDSADGATLYLPCCADLPDGYDAPEPVQTKPEAYRYSRTNTVHTHLCPTVKTMLNKAGEGRLLAGWAVYPMDEAQADLVSGHSKDCSRCERIRRAWQIVERLQAEPQGYFSAAAKVAHTADCASMKAAKAGKLHIALLKTGFKPVSVLLAMIAKGEAKECRSCAKVRHSH